MLHDLGGFRHVFADLNAGDIGADRLELTSIRRARFHVEHIDGAGAASHPQQDCSLITLLNVRRIGHQRVCEVDRGSSHQCRGTSHVTHEVAACHTLRNEFG